jgi:transcriptional regulator with GAF, ATPase, and Fis domain
MHVFDRSDDQPGTGDGGLARSAAPPPDELGWPPDQALSSLLDMVAAAELTLADVLRHVAEEAADRVPGADAVLAVVRRADDTREAVHTDELAVAVDELQRGLREGPVLDAVAHRDAVVSGDLSQETRWPALARSVGTSPVRSALCVPLLVEGVAVGALSLYARAVAAFDDAARQRAVRLAASAGPTVGDVLVLDRARRLTLQLHLGGADRAAVDEAITVLMEENGVGADEALAVLETLGRTEHEDLVEVARAIVAAREGRA